jgi:hypothetical protein
MLLFNQSNIIVWFLLIRETAAGQQFSKGCGVLGGYGEELSRYLHGGNPRVARILAGALSCSECGYGGCIALSVHGRDLQQPLEAMDQFRSNNDVGCRSAERRVA